MLCSGDVLDQNPSVTSAGTVKRLGWTNTLPAGWELMPLRGAVYCRVSNVDKLEVDGEIPVQLCNYTDVYNNEFIRPGLALMRATASEAEIARFALSVDDVVITKDSEAWDDIGVPALVVETSDNLVCGYHLALLRPRTDVIDGAFLFRCLQAKPIQVQLDMVHTFTVGRRCRPTALPALVYQSRRLRPRSCLCRRCRSSARSSNT